MLLAHHHRQEIKRKTKRDLEMAIIRKYHEERRPNLPYSQRASRKS